MITKKLFFALFFCCDFSVWKLQLSLLENDIYEDFFFISAIVIISALHINQNFFFNRLSISVKKFLTFCFSFANIFHMLRKLELFIRKIPFRKINLFKCDLPVTAQLTKIIQVNEIILKTIFFFLDCEFYVIYLANFRPFFLNFTLLYTFAEPYIIIYPTMSTICAQLKRFCLFAQGSTFGVNFWERRYQ